MLLREGNLLISGGFGEDFDFPPNTGKIIVVVRNLRQLFSVSPPVWTKHNLFQTNPSLVQENCGGGICDFP